MKNKKAQVWVETVTYTLVAFIMITLVLSFAKPKIEELQDKAILEQSLSMLQEIDLIILDLEDRGMGNKRKVDLSIKKGELEIDSLNDSLIFTINSKYEYSQLNQSYQESDLFILTQKQGNEYLVEIKKYYSNLNITYQEKDENKKISQATTPYAIYISNKGGSNQIIDFELE